MRYKKKFLTITLMSVIIICFCTFFLLQSLEAPLEQDNSNNQSSKSPYLTPSGIRLTIIDNLNDSIIITWFTEEKASEPKVRYSNNSGLSNAKEIEPNMTEISHTFIYVSKLENLKPNTMYYYQVSSDENNEREIMSFNTFPNQINKLKFVVISDPQSGDFSIMRNIFRIIKEEEDFDFLINCGDVVDDGYEQWEWNEYFNVSEIINSHKIGFYIEGNHDNSDGLTYMYDNIPMINYSYRYEFDELLSLLALDTEGERKPTDNWIDNQLNNTNTIWKIPFMHKPVHNTQIGRHDNNPQWANYFTLHNVNIIFSGHNHYYERQYANEPIYIICHPVGISPRGEHYYNPRSFSQFFYSANGYITVELDDNELNMNVFRYDEYLQECFKVDSIKIVK